MNVLKFPIYSISTCAVNYLDSYILDIEILNSEVHNNLRRQINLEVNILVKNRFSAVFICLLIVLTMSGYSNGRAEASSLKKNVGLSVSYIKNKPEKAGNLKVKDFKNSSVNFSTINIDSKGVNVLEGTIKIDDQFIPFLFRGQFYQVPGAEGRVSGVLVDDLSNFEVTRFELQNDPSKGIFLSKKLSGNSFALYLTKKDTNELYIIEDSTSKIIEGSILTGIYKNIKNLDRAPDEAAMWVSQLFKPDSTVETTGDSGTLFLQPGEAQALAATKNNNLLQLSDPSDNESGIQLQSVYQKYTTHSYTDTYYIFTYTTTDLLTLREDAFFPTSTSENIISDIKVTGIRYSEDNGTVLDYYTGWRVGDGPNGGLLGLKLNTNSPQFIRTQALDGVLYDEGGFSMDWSYSQSYLGISAEFKFSAGGSQDINKTFDILPSGTKVITASKGARNTTLANKGDYFGTEWDIATASGAGTTSAKASVTFQYSVYNLNSKASSGAITEYSTSNAIQSL